MQHTKGIGESDRVPVAGGLYHYGQYMRECTHAWSVNAEVNMYAFGILVECPLREHSIS